MKGATADKLMKKLGLLKKDTNINFLKYRKVYFALSLILVVAFIVIPIVKGFNLGVDFKGGMVVEVTPVNSKNANITSVEKKINTLKIPNVSFQKFKSDNIIAITIDESSLGMFKNKDALTGKIKQTLGNKYTFLKSDYVGPSVSGELLKSGIISVIFGLLGIFLYIWYRFDWQYGLIGIATLIHDAIIGVGALALFNYEVNITTIAAVLTIIGYSINDTIITFNQVKENIKRYANLDNISLLNVSLNDVLSRTISTSLTVILVLFSVYILGGEALTSFSFTLLIGVICGTYSSICLSVPLLLYIANFRTANKVKNDEKNIKEKA